MTLAHTQTHSEILKLLTCFQIDIIKQYQILNPFEKLKWNSPNGLRSDLFICRVTFDPQLLNLIRNVVYYKHHYLLCVCEL